jgi:hypothetical protein
MSKTVSYKNLLKQAISEYDTSKTVQVKGPMLDPILSWDGDGEIPVYKDAASILERYYFNERQEDPILVQDLNEKEYYNDDGQNPKSASEKDAQCAGTQQAGTGDAEGQVPPRKDLHDQMVKPKKYTEEGEDFLDDLNIEEILGEDELLEKEWSDKDVPKKKEYTDEGAPNGLGRIARGQPDMDSGEPYTEEYMKESFELFKEAIKEDDEDDEIIV